MAPIQMLQDNSEIDALAKLVEREGCRSLLEIGSKFGGSLWHLVNAMPEGSRVVSVDLPHGTRAWNESSKSLQLCLRSLRDYGYDTKVIWGNSLHKEVVDQVRAHAPYDFVFIDADHSMNGVTTDWKNYGSMGRIVAFHDIKWKRELSWVGVRIDVPEFWNEIKKNYRHEEFCFCPTGKNNGIGVLWRS